MAHGFDHVACARFAFGAYHGRALANTAQCLAQVAAAAHEGHLEVVLVYVVTLVGGREHFALVNIVNAYSFEYACLHEVPNAALCHDGNAHSVHDTLDHLRVTHAGHAALDTNVGGHSLQRHDSHGPRIL